MRDQTNSIPNRSWPGSITAVTRDCYPRVVGGHVTWIQRKRRCGRKWRQKREKREEKKKVKRVNLKVGTLNVGTMTGKGREIADVMERRDVDVLCVRETRWKGAKARCIGGGYKLWYFGNDNTRNGVNIILKKELVDRAIEVCRISDRVICLKLELEGLMINIVSAYVPQTGCPDEVKEAFWQDIEETVQKIPKEERLVIGADLNDIYIYIYVSIYIYIYIYIYLRK